MTTSRPTDDDYTISTDPQRIDLDAVHSFLSRAYWSPGVPRETVEKALANSLCFALLHRDDGQVGLARVVTDRATFAYLADVYVLETHRGRGLSKRLMQAVGGHPELQGLRRMLLATRDAHDLYRQFGFKPLANPTRMMERWDPNAYGATPAS